MGIAAVVPAENRVGDVISELNESGGSGVNEQRDFGKAAYASPFRADVSEVTGHALERSLVRAVVKNDQTSLPVSISPQPSKKEIESAANVFECKGHGIFVRE